MNIGSFDQMKESLKDIAAILMEHYNQMLKAGFNEKQALQLTIGFQESFIRGQR